MLKNNIENKETGKRVAIVTGGTRGIGLSITKSLAENGMSVLAVYRSNSKEAEIAVEKLKEEGLEIDIFRADVSLKAEAEKVAEYAGNKWGRIDILVNNAGIFESC